MKILALDTTAKTATAALYDGGRLKSLYTLNTTKTHSENMLPMIEEMMKRAECTFDDMDAFACACGPGSFTGVRIGVALLKGIAFGREKPCVGVSTLEALAQNACVAGMEQSLLICPVMDARREQVYNALFERRDGCLVRLCEDRPVSREELLACLAAYGDRRVLLVGDGAYLFDGDLSDTLLKAAEPMLRQNAFSVACVAARMLEQGKGCTDMELVPTYLRPSSAERMRNNGPSNNDMHG